jgi:hypothetical protein
MADRRRFVGIVAGGLRVPLIARAQSAMPVIGSTGNPALLTFPECFGTQGESPTRATGPVASKRLSKSQLLREIPLPGVRD